MSIPTIRIVNLRTEEAPTDGVYIGRAMPRRGLRKSPLANPFRLERNATPAEREACIAQYRRWLAHLVQYGSGSQAAEILRLADLARRDGSISLCCWCHPEPCHGDVVREYVEAELRGASMFRRSPP